MHKCCSAHLRIRTAIMKQRKETEKEGKHKSENGKKVSTK